MRLSEGRRQVFGLAHPKRFARPEIGGGGRAQFAEGYRVASWLVSGAFLGRTLATAALRRDHGITVLGVYREHAGTTKDGARYRKLDAIDPDYALADGDTLLVVGERERVDRFLSEHA